MTPEQPKPKYHSCEYKYRCKFHTNDSLCNEIPEGCRVHNEYARAAQKKKEEAADQDRHHTHNDIGLVARLLT